MEHRTRRSILVMALLCAWGAATTRARAQNAVPEIKSGAEVQVAISQSLAPMDGNHLKVTIVEVSYAPGASSPSHSHPCPVIGYVLQGALRTKVKGESERIYKAGETFYEAANGVHEVSANASGTEAAKFLAYFVCDHEAALSVPQPLSHTGGGN